MKDFLRNFWPIPAIKSDISKISDEITAVNSNISDLSKQLSAIQRNISEIDIRTNPAAAIGYNGDASNSVYLGFIGTERPISNAPAPIPFGSTVCQQVHFALDQYRFWVRAMKDRPKYLRKQWEFVYIAQALYERGLLAPGRKGLGFGVGREPLPALFASFGAEVVATDQSLEGAIRAGWINSNEHSTDLSALNDRGICTDRMFSELVKFAEADMNEISPAFDGGFDFCWSACSLEHLGSLDHGLNFIKNSVKTLKPGGIAIHTTEFNLSSNTDTIEHRDLSVYRRQDMERLIAELEAEGHQPEPFDWSLGDGFAEMVVDLPPYGRGEPHIRLRLGDFDCTSIGIIVKRGH
ncbi:methyltransferase domain-containing protein [Methyloraptor flagellatus]|uniref:Class I SAM-dependent methyltransferase n=1 Tax=Methyloraptor flagellatus TaxID=3162530 RepID=A0AAU7X9Z1_9HYPH